MTPGDSSSSRREAIIAAVLEKLTRSDSAHAGVARYVASRPHVSRSLAYETTMLTPEQVHFGNADQVIAGRKSVLREAWAAHPERFVRGVPKPKPLPEAVFINPPIPSLTTQDIAL